MHRHSLSRLEQRSRPMDVEITFVLSPPKPDQRSVMPEVAGLLSARHARVRTIVPDETIVLGPEGRAEADLFVLKTPSEVALSFAGALHTSGRSVLNPYPVAAACRDKFAAAHRLWAAGVPVPETYLASDRAQLSLLLEDGPLILKPPRGSGGAGIRIVHKASEIARDPALPVLAQRYHRPDGDDLKIYRIGAELFGVKRVWPARTYEQKLGEPFVLDDELREIAVQCGNAFGIDLYGFDVIESAGHRYVVDISSFPGFKGVPDAARRLARYIFDAARTAHPGTRYRGEAAAWRVTA